MRKSKLIITILLIAGCLLLVTNIHASNLDELKARIEERNKQIAEIQKEIEQYQQEIDKNAKEANTLKKQINLLEITKKKLASDIYLTQKQIESAELTLEDLGLQIQNKEKDINAKLLTLAEIIRNMNDAESTSLVELILSQHNFSDFFGDLEQIENFQKEININLTQLQTLKKILEDEEVQKETQKNNLENFKSKLSDQKQLVEINKTNKNKLLQDTKNKETNYKKLLAEKTKLRESFEKELEELESQLRIEIDPASLPAVGRGVLGWPFTTTKMQACKSFTSLGNMYCITQYFGNTAFATANPQLYKSGMHNGVDFKASEGTEILASADGVVRETGDTDRTCRYASFGKWILIEHNNGLSTLYAHLSLIKVVPGQTVARGQLVGYSGNSGSSTGPHLHFTVYATKGVKIGSLPSKGCKGKIFIIPMASYNSYLNPLSYL